MPAWFWSVQYRIARPWEQTYLLSNMAESLVVYGPQNFPKDSKLRKDPSGKDGRGIYYIEIGQDCFWFVVVFKASKCVIEKISPKMEKASVLKEVLSITVG